jgi:hypothetical protein
MAESEHEQIADQLQEQSDSLERHTNELEDDIKQVKSEWERKRSDPSVPGAPSPEEGGEQEPSEQQTPPW